MIEKFLFQPVSPWHINQGFGENKACIDNTTGKVFDKVPFLDTTPCPPGSHSVYSQMLGHNALDVMASRWQPVYAAQSGIVNEVCTEVERGLGVGIVHDEKKRFCKETGKEEYFKTRYWHFIGINVKIGQRVKTGDLIGWADSTGYSSGDHLHFELKPVTINSVIDGIPHCTNILQDNGYFGAIDPTSYLEDIYALQFAGLWRRLQEAVARVAELVADLARK